MTEHAQQPGTVISVSGEAEHVVAPDFATLTTSLSAVGPDKDAVLEQVTRAHGATLDALRQLGGVALSVATTGAPLTWSTRSFSAHVWHEHDYRTGDSRPAGWRADVPVTIVLRDLGRLSELAAAIAALPELELNHVSWSVDPRNPAWPVVRAAAIQDAIAKARDYAASLGGQLTALLHVADAGLLGGGDGARRARGEMYAVPMSGSFSGEDSTPALDPVPQQISSIIEARFEADVDAL